MVGISFSLLFSRVLLLLHLVRGKAGVTIVGVILSQKQFLVGMKSNIHKADFWIELLVAVKAKLAKLGKPFTHLRHAEGFIAGLSGIHPLYALAKSKLARTLFEAAATSWSAILQKTCNRGYVFTSDDLLGLWSAVHDKVVLALDCEGRVRKARTYTAMSFARGCAMLASTVFRRRVAVYTKELHMAMAGGQSWSV